MTDNHGTDCAARASVHNQEISTYGNCPVCRSTTKRPPYEPGDRIADRIAVNGATYAVVACHPIDDLMAGATRANWQVIFRLPTGNDHYVWVDDFGYTPKGMFGPRSSPTDLAEYVLGLGQPAHVDLATAGRLLGPDVPAPRGPEG